MMSAVKTRLVSVCQVSSVRVAGKISECVACSWWKSVSNGLGQKMRVERPTGGRRQA